MVFVSRRPPPISLSQRKKTFNAVSTGAKERRGGNSIRTSQLSEKLFKTLDIEALIGLFFDEIQWDIPHDGATYSNRKLAIDLPLGTSVGYRMEYSLIVNGQELGEVVIARSRLFTAKEMTLMESLIDCLVYPLRNASMYRLAMMSAFQDPLTGINNRASLEQFLPREISLTQRHNTPLTLLVIDVDRFKSINDTHGHPVGDSVLRNLTQVFTHRVRATDLVFRYGGDEFVVALSNTDIDDARDVAERIREGVEIYQFNAANVQLIISVSIGMTALNGNDTLESAFRRADQALLLAKQKGRNQVARV